MTLLTLAQANLIADKALDKAQSSGFQPQTVVVLDSGGHIKVIKRSDGASLLRPEIAFGKAWGVLGMGFGGRDLAKRCEAAPAFFTALTAVSNGRMVPVAGGVLIKNAQNEIIGSIGISGDDSDNDEICAVAGVLASGLIADTGA
ncbi:heme-binding protein [Polynucleobacter sp.]|jgi:uncharacterized protein GlcG (DUF336 family)|uniref:GlcG/HbpS family heme-binding protein n=1 Tax=Polynucleobacter sp. TaxID=2029855 RepID=UPI0030180EB9